MKLLLDTNVFLEIFLEQDQAAEARSLLSRGDDHEFFTSDFSVHSIGLLLFRRKQHQAFRLFLKDVLLTASASLLSLGVADMDSIVAAAQRFNLDFDDAYQYVAAEKYDLTLVSLDDDFDRTERGRQTLAQIVGGAT
jgi:predicted nucleic acid-binding protein